VVWLPCDWGIRGCCWEILIATWEFESAAGGHGTETAAGDLELRLGLELRLLLGDLELRLLLGGLGTISETAAARVGDVVAYKIYYFVLGIVFIISKFSERTWLLC
jgi:hypothetical protein